MTPKQEHALWLARRCAEYGDSIAAEFWASFAEISEHFPDPPCDREYDNDS